ncbi:MAG: biotin carboxylase N-terminal domain-containing protein [Pseudomonadota bacterium]
MGRIARLLVANRGEIAVRIIATARRMGIETVAVYSDADAGALHVRAADHAVRLGPAPPAESYLDAARMVAAAKAAGADAIHPGYGFLSEAPEFAEAVAAAGLIFVGPPAPAIRAMGLKDAAKRRMEAAGVPVVPGYHGAAQDPDALREAAGEIGYPVLIKAVAGGGGKGMRRVAEPGGFPGGLPGGFDEALAACQAEAQAAFGDPRVLIERWIESPRHIEIQVFADAAGGIVHLFERDCSLQRRHQKVIEEAPAPGMTAEIRAAMGAAAVRAAAAIGYVGAGTVEFIADGNADGQGGLAADGFWFMEMNTRLQVEHPVTEAVTGIDLVEWQLRVASGETLPQRQDEIALRGHAMEARLYAEDPAAGFLPVTGRLTHVRFPDAVRSDTGVASGDSVTPHYDPMIAKLIAHGPDRETARRRLVHALRATEIAGSTTNLAFLTRLLQDRDVARGKVDTGLIDRGGAALVDDPPVPSRVVAVAALAAAGLETVPHRGFTLWHPLEQSLALRQGGETRHVGLTFDTEGVRLLVGETHLCAAMRGGHWWVDGAPAPACHRDGAVITVFDGQPWRFEIPDPLARGAVDPGEDVVRAPMPGLLREVFVACGAEVAAGDRLAVLEAMKMEHALRAPRAGIVAEVNGIAGSQVEAGAPLFRLSDGATDIADIADAAE